MDTTASSRTDFRDHQETSSFQQHSFPHNQYTHTTPYHRQPLPQFSQHEQRQTTTTALPTVTSSLTRPFPTSDSMPRLPHSSTLPTPSHSQPSYQPQFKPLPTQDPHFSDQKSPRQQEKPHTTHHPLSSITQPQQSLHDERPFNNPTTTPSFPPPSAPLSLERKPEPFPYSKSLPYPLGHQSHPSTKPSSTLPQTSTPSTTTPTAPTTSTPQQSTPSPPRPNSSIPQEQGPLYDIAKLLAAHCTILSGKVYNDKGHNICGVLNQHDKPCKRIGKCPFHGAHKPVTADNSVNGDIDASGTVATPSTSPDATHSPPGQSTAYNRSPGGSDSTAVNGSRPRIPPKQQYKHGWSKEEHFLFLGGLNQHGKGSWKQIASVVKTRTPTQVQSHAQKYFQRQRQADKNKRSIHDLSLESPEMLEVAKKFRAGGHRVGLPGGGMADPLPITGMPDGGQLRGQPVTMAPSALSLSQNPLHGDSVGRGVLNDGGLARFGNTVHNSLVSKFGPGQATSATTLGSSLSSGVQISQMPGATAPRTFPAVSTHVGQSEFFGHLNQGTITSGQHRRPVDNRLPMKLDSAPGRDVILNSVRPAFMPDAYQGHTSGQILPGQNLLGAKQSLYTGQHKTTAGLHGNEPVTTSDHGTTQTAYQTSALQGLYPQVGQVGGGSSIFPQQPRGNNESQLQWTYDNDGKVKRPREVNAMNRDAFNLQNTQLSNTLQGIASIPIPEHLSGAAAATIANEHQVPSVDQPFDGTHQNQGNAFANGIFWQQ